MTLGKKGQLQSVLGEGVTSTTMAPTILHVFSDDVDGFLCDHRIKAYQSLVLQLFHQVSFSQEGIRRHTARFQAFHRYLGMPIVVPCGGGEVIPRHPSAFVGGCTNLDLHSVP